MKCPHCEYQDGYEWNEGELESVEGEHGKFWTLPVEMQREHGWGPTERSSLYACPGCKKTFVD